MNTEHTTPPILTISLLEGASFDMVYVEGGEFMMGLENDPDAYGDEKPVHKVTVPSFFMAKYPVTQRLWKAVMGGEEHPSTFQGETRPKEKVSWDDAKAFIEKLNNSIAVQQYLKGLNLLSATFRLPSEAEWEYAAKGGNAFPKTGIVTSEGFKYSGSDKLKEVGWYDENSHNETKPIGLKFPNKLGLFDMSGNVWEWCEDDSHDNYNKAPDDGSAWIDSPKRGVNRVYRGGNFYGYSRLCSCSYRGYHSPGIRLSNTGFRLALSPQLTGKPDGCH